MEQTDPHEDTHHQRHPRKKLTYYERLGNKFLDCRTKAKMTRTEVEKRSGIRLSRIAELESGRGGTMVADDVVTAAAAIGYNLCLSPRPNFPKPRLMNIVHTAMTRGKRPTFVFQEIAKSVPI